MGGMAGSDRCMDHYGDVVRVAGFSGAGIGCTRFVACWDGYSDDLVV